MICVRFLQFLAKGRWFRRSQLTSSPAVIDNRLFRWGIVLPLSTGIRDCSFFPECPHRPWSPTSFLKVRMKAKRPALGLTTHHHLITKLIILGFVSPCIIIHSNKSTNQMHQSFFQIYCSSFKYSSTCFGHPLAPHQEPDRPRPTTLLPPRSNGKPEAATAVYKLLMMGKRMPETC